MFSKKKNLIMAGGALAAVIGTVMTGCGDKPVASTADTYGLKAVSINSSAIFKGDVSLIPGLPPRPEQNTALPKATTAALLNFDKAYAMVSQSLTHDIEYTMCEYWTDRYNAFKDVDSSDLNKWETVVAGCRRSGFYEIVSVSELEKNGSYVEGTIYVKPGGNIVAVYFVNSRGEIIWTNRNTYYNLDGLENSDNESFQYYLEYYESGWEYTWNTEDSREFITWSGSVPGYHYQVPNLGYWQNEIGIPASFVNDECTNAPPVLTLNTPYDNAINVYPLSVAFYAYANDPDDYQLTYTLYCDENPYPTTVIYTATDCDYYATLNAATTYYWRVSVTDGENVVNSAVRSFTTQ